MQGQALVMTLLNKIGLAEDAQIIQLGLFGALPSNVVALSLHRLNLGIAVC